MKKALLFTAAIVVIVLVGSSCLYGYFATKEKRAASVPWSAGLGSLDDAPRHFPLVTQSAGATKLVALASRAHIDMVPRYHARDTDKAMKPNEQGADVRKALGDYIKEQFERSGDAIDAPPPLAAHYLAENDAALNAVRDHLLSGAPIAWDTNVREGVDQPLPNLLGIMHLQRALAARALDKARRNDPAAWDDLHASWELNRSLWHRPDLISILIALATTRMSNAAARNAATGAGLARRNIFVRLPPGDGGIAAGGGVDDSSDQAPALVRG